MLKTLNKPNSHDAFNFINKFYKSDPNKSILILIGNCMVNYNGRARSILDWGERIIMIKQDGNVLVHQPLLREPINWQPCGSKTDFYIKNNNLILKSYNKKPSEKMKIDFKEIKLLVVTSLFDPANLVITGMESDVVNDIISNPCIIEEGLRITKREKHVKSGLIDLFGFDIEHVPVIIEVKRSLANISAVHQLRMYVNDVKGDVEDAEVRGILCAPRIPDLVKNLLADYNLEWREVERRLVMPDDWQKTLKDF